MSRMIASMWNNFVSSTKQSPLLRVMNHHIYLALTKKEYVQRFPSPLSQLMLCGALSLRDVVLPAFSLQPQCFSLLTPSPLSSSVDLQAHSICHCL